jgi:cell division protease FtsH
MSAKMGPVTFGKEAGMVFLGRDFGDERKYSEDTSRLIDAEIKRILEAAYSAATKILTDHRDQMDLLAKTLIEKETLDAEEVRKLLGLADPKPIEQTPPPPSL